MLANKVLPTSMIFLPSYISKNVFGLNAVVSVLV